MRGKITYWYHSCFTLELNKIVMLFDYPNRGIDSSLDEQIKSTLGGAELFVFISHAHGDHFSPDVKKFSSHAEKTHYIVSSDILEDRIISERSGSESTETLTRVRPDQEYEIEDLRVKTFQSNDAGVAFLIDVYDKKFYFGGDLAKWDWPEWGEEKTKRHVKIFEEVKNELKDEEIDIAFSNMDERLPSWAGPIDFIEDVEPTHFIPMHTFGNEEWIDDLMNADFEALSKIFNYEKPGDSYIFEI